MKKFLFRIVQTALLTVLVSMITSAQFIDQFDGGSLRIDPSGLNGWTYFTGDGEAEMTFSSSDKGFSSINVDATKDKRGIWWALIRRCVSKNMDLKLLKYSHFALRIEARVKVSDAPKRVNLHLNTQRTTDFHTHLMEFDIPDTSNWHTISMTTKNFDAVPGDSVYGQLALMDWGLEKYKLNVDYFRVDIVNTDSSGSDKGVQVPYHPHVQNIQTFKNHILVEHDCIIDLEYSDKNFNNWSVQDDSATIRLLTASGTQYIILKWDLAKYTGRKVNGSGILELITYSFQRSHEYVKDFGMIRVAEIIGGDPLWAQNEVTYNSFCMGNRLNKVINSQMIIDVDVSKECGSKNMITISNPVLQRMLDGKTLGLAIKPLGAINASFYAMENQSINLRAKLYLNIYSE